MTLKYLDHRFLETFVKAELMLLTALETGLGIDFNWSATLWPPFFIADGFNSYF